MNKSCKCPEEESKTFLLPYQTDIGYAAVAIGRLLIYRRDLQVGIREGQIRVGYIDQEWDDFPLSIGVQGIEPLAREWENVVTLASSLPRIVFPLGPVEGTSAVSTNLSQVVVKGVTN